VIREELFGLPGAEFVAARDASARALAKEGRREDAAAIRALRRPTRSAELLNMLARTEPKAVKALTDAGDALRTALEAGKRAGVDEARQEVSAAVDGLLGAARREGASEQVLAEVATSLQAAAGAVDSGEQLREGCLERALDPPGFEALAGLTLPQASRPEPQEPQPVKTSVAERAAERERVRLERRVAVSREALHRAEEAHRAAEAALAEFTDAEA
jgi:hypothetical protein